MQLAERNALLEEYLPLVKGVLARLGQRLPSHVDRDDLHSAGVLGLMDALTRFDPERVRSFRAFASLRIRGAMLDELRRLDPSPRRMRDRKKLLADAVREAEATHGRAPTSAELCAILGINEETLENWQKETPVVLLAFDKPADGDDGEGTATLHDVLADGTEDVRDTLERTDHLERMVRLIAELPDRDRKVLAMIYAEGMRLEEIGEALGLTDSRVCQIRNDAVALLRRRMRQAPNQSAPSACWPAG